MIRSNPRGCELLQLFTVLIPGADLARHQELMVHFEVLAFKQAAKIHFLYTVVVNEFRLVDQMRVHREHICQHHHSRHDHVFYVCVLEHVFEELEEGVPDRLRSGPLLLPVQLSAKANKTLLALIRKLLLFFLTLCLLHGLGEATRGAPSAAAKT